MLWRLVFATLFVFVTARAQLTFFPSDANIPQARSKDELDAYGLVYESKDPTQTIALGERFLKAFRDSQFRSYVLVHEMYAYEAMDNYEALVATGRQAIVVYPKSHDVLLMLANSIASRLPPEGPERQRLLVEAENFALQDRELLDRLVRSPAVTRQDFHHYRQQAKAANAAVFGLIDLQRGQMDKAIVEYEKATVFSPRGVDYYRLGIAYQMCGQNDKAIQRLERAAELGPPMISSLAQRRIRDLQAGGPKEGKN
jgi:tetratricopeptide (TPR) repeat protein